MITLKSKYDNEINALLDNLVNLGTSLSDCQHINENLTSEKYKEECITRTNTEIEAIKNKIKKIIISISDSSFINIQYT